MKLIKSTKNSFKWSFFIQLANQLFGFIVSIILARILSPSDFGILGILMIFISLSQKITDGGFAASLIRTKEIDDKDFSVVFYYNLFCSLLLYLFLFLASPFIADFFEVTMIETLLKVYGLSIIITAFTITQSVRLNKALDFKSQFRILIPSLVLSGTIGVCTAYLGYGVWSLVIKDLSFYFFSSLQLWVYSKWKPLWLFDKEIFKYHFNFGYKLVLTDLITQIFKDSYKAIISKSFSPAQLGFFTRAKSMEELPTSIVFNTFNRVLFPLLSEVQDNHDRLREVYSQIIKVVSFFLTPFLMLFFLIAEPLFVFLLTDKWLPAVPYFQILIIAGIIAPYQPFLLNICKVMGRSDLILKLSLTEYFLTAISMLLIFPFGINGLLWGLVGASLIKLIVTMIFAGRLIEYSFKRQLLDFKEGLTLSIFGGLIIYFVNSAEILPVMSLWVGIVIKSVLFYVSILAFSFVLKFESINLMKKFKIGF